jgi:hypothetical protein
MVFDRIVFGLVSTCEYVLGYFLRRFAANFESLTSVQANSISRATIFWGVREAYAYGCVAHDFSDVVFVMHSKRCPFHA